MKVRPFTRTMMVGALVVSFSVAVAGLLITTPFAGETLAAVSEPMDQDSLSAIARVLVPQSTAAYNGVVTPSRKVHAPWVLGGTSVLRVYNAGEAAATVQATFSYLGSEALVDMEAGTVTDIHATGIPTGTKVSAILTADQPIVAVVNDFGPIGQYATSYSAMPDSVGRRNLALPDIFSRAPGGWESDLVVQNVGATTATVTVIYTKTNEPFTTTHWIDSSIPELAPGQTYFFSPDQAGVPGKFVGFAAIEADQPVIAVVRNSVVEIGSVFPERAYAYRVPLPGPETGGEQSLYFPLLVNAFEDWEKSEIQILNAGLAGIAFTLDIGSSVYPKSVSGWWVDSYPQDVAGSQSPPGQAVPGRVENARTLQSLVWLNGQGRFIDDFLAAYSAPGAGAKSWYLPYTDQGDTTETYVAVQNISDVPVNISLTYHSLTGTVGTFNDTIQGSNASVYMRDDGLPSEFVGGVVVEADQSIAAVTLIAGQLVLDKEIFLPIALRKQ